MSQEKFWILFSKKLSGEASAEDLEELQLLVQQHPEWQYSIQNLEDLWKHNPPVTDQMQEEDAYLLHLHRMNELNIPFGDNPANDRLIDMETPSRRKWYWAAAAVLAISAGLLLFNRISRGSGTDKDAVAGNINEVSTRPGSKSMVKLPDGSTVWLNAGSKISYTKDFGKDIREVYLTGEGFFDVTKNKEKPFIIHTSSINIKVLGTSFNVRAYPEDKQTETSLIHGSIEVTIKNRPNDKIILSPSEKLIVENNQALQTENVKPSTVKAVPATAAVAPMVSINKLKYNVADSTVAETQWINNKLVFRDESFADLAVRMERWYDVNIEINDPVLRQARLNGIFEKETIQQALEALRLSLPLSFKYDQNGNNIIIHR
ncbi:MAG: FecR family protein [Bacteroidetes bacterium]|nr:FecR family protein [Bacteroidota bacterium]